MCTHEIFKKNKKWYYRILSNGMIIETSPEGYSDKLIASRVGHAAVELYKMRRN